MLKKQFTDVFNAYAAEGAGAMAGVTLSHICFKFVSQESYAAYVDAARQMGRVTQEQFNGKQITWCRLEQPLEKDGLRLEWLEMVEPRFEKNAFDGVTSVGYSEPALKEVVKQTSADGKMLFRYQSQHASDMAPK